MNLLEGAKLGLVASLRSILSALGLGIQFRLYRIKWAGNESLNLNVGAGRYVIPNFKNLDVYTPHYYRSKSSFLKSRIEYDITSDTLPFGDSTVDNIYISHVLEHVEERHAVRFLEESYRVLVEGGVLRVVCPDAKFLFDVSQFDNSYWQWRRKTFKNLKRFDVDWANIEQYDFLVHELSSPRCRYSVRRIPEAVETNDTLQGLDYESLKDFLRTGLTYRRTHPGDHINCWDY